ncbi:integrase core domain-containing protein, partial [Streptomyces mirabilis]
RQPDRPGSPSSGPHAARMLPPALPNIDFPISVNALAESFWQGLKRETMHQRLFSTMRQARPEIFQWLTYYNGRRRHSALNYRSPVEFEQQQQRARRLTLAA